MGVDIPMILGLLVSVMNTVLGLPLLLRAIPPNRFYGWRTAQAFASPGEWYRLNAAAGWALVAAGVAGLILWGLLQGPLASLIGHASRGIVAVCGATIFTCVAIAIVAVMMER